jgi:hypothetical protein
MMIGRTVKFSFKYTLFCLNVRKCTLFCRRVLSVHVLVVGGSTSYEVAVLFTSKLPHYSFISVNFDSSKKCQNISNEWPYFGRRIDFILMIAILFTNKNARLFTSYITYANQKS